MTEVVIYHQELRERIAPIVEKLFQANSLYQVKLKKVEMIEMLVDLFSQFTSQELQAIDENEMTRRIKQLLTLEAVSGTLNDLPPEQIAIFDAAVQGI